MKIVQIKTTLLSVNDYNPNVVEEHIMDQLKKDVERVGIKQPIIVRKDPEHDSLYIIIDGEHRWRSAAELGIEKVPCEVLDINESEAKIMTITMNRFRGEFDSLKLAEVLKSLKDTYSSEELEELLGYRVEELQAFDDLLEFDLDSFSTGAIDKEVEEIANNMNSNEELLNEFSVSLTLNQLEIVEGALEQVGPKFAISKSEALEALCKQYLEKNKPEVLKEIAGRRKQLDNLEQEEENSSTKEA